MEEMTQVEVSDLQPGDKVLWGDRKEPLEVQDQEIAVQSHYGELEAREVESRHGTTYYIHEPAMGVGDPKVKRETGVLEQVSEGYAKELRKVNE